VDIRQIADKFPNKRGGLKELYDKGPQSSFFLVKFWVDIVAFITGFFFENCYLFVAISAFGICYYQ